ncbi:MAG: alpha/beta hydrolase [Verrucomicrobiaceae bacterium]|nr:alpha/beta hydrolase [Verrucomicrobiaceae bacterium]
MKPHRTLITATLSVLLASSLITASDANAQAAQRKRRPNANPEGRAITKPLPESVKVERDIVYATYGERKVMLDLYLPKQPGAAKIPCIVVIHGGGWRSGDKTRFAALASKLAEQGFAAACIGYRLLPEVQFPAPIVDCKAAVRWVRANAPQHGIDPDRIGTIGGSAGAHLAAMLGTSDQEPKLEGDGGNPGISSRVQAVVAMATPADMSNFAERTKIDPALAALISPVTHVSKDSAPILIMHGTQDRTVPLAQSELLLSKYKTAGASAEFFRVEGAPHAFWNGQWFNDTLKRAVEFFRKQLSATSVAGGAGN